MIYIQQKGVWTYNIEDPDPSGDNNESRIEKGVILMAGEVLIPANHHTAQESAGDCTPPMNAGTPGECFMQNKGNFQKA
jgi:hypothetical protein